LRTLIAVNGKARDHAVPSAIAAEAWLSAFRPILPGRYPPQRDGVLDVFVGSTGRPKGIVHLQHDMAYSDLAFARNVLKLTPDDICFRCQMFFAYGLAIPSPFRFRQALRRFFCPASRSLRLFSMRSNAITQRILRIADALYVADKGRRRGGAEFFFIADGTVRRRSVVRRSLQRLEDDDRS